MGRTKLPERASVEMELLNAREELRVCEAEMRELEKAVEDASNPSRLRLLPGGIPTRDELSEKLEKVEVCIGSRYILRSYVCVHVHVCMCTCVYMYMCVLVCNVCGEVHSGHYI